MELLRKQKKNKWKISIKFNNVHYLLHIKLDAVLVASWEFKQKKNAI